MHSRVLDKSRALCGIIEVAGSFVCSWGSHTMLGPQAKEMVLNKRKMRGQVRTLTV